MEGGFSAHVHRPLCQAKNSTVTIEALRAEPRYDMERILRSMSCGGSARRILRSMSFGGSARKILRSMSCGGSACKIPRSMSCGGSARKILRSMSCGGSACKISRSVMWRLGAQNSALMSCGGSVRNTVSVLFKFQKNRRATKHSPYYYQ